MSAGTTGKTISALGASLMLVMALAATAVADADSGWRGGPSGGWGADAGMTLPLLLRTANLTPEQSASVRAILASRRNETRHLIDQLRQAQMDLADRLFSRGSVQAADVQPQVQRIAQLREQLLQQSLQTALEVRALLTQDQLARVAQAKDRLRQLQTEMRQLLGPGR